MERLYRKIGRRYVEYGFGGIPDISDGIWLVQNNSHSKSQSSLLWKVGDIKRPVDVTAHASIQSMERDITNYLMKLSDVNSIEYNEALEICGGYLRGPVHFTNISASDIIMLLLRQIAIKCEQV